MSAPSTEPDQAAHRDRSIRLAAITSLISIVGTIVLRLVSIPIAMRVLGIEGFGAYAAITLAVGIIDMLHVGISPALTREISLTVAKNDWKRSPKRVPLIPLGTYGEWDDEMTFGSGPWIEVGDEWWFYYSGHDGGHNTKGRKAAIGLATCKKERLVSLRGPKNGGGVVITRTLTWPGGELFLNTAAVDPESDSEVTVRVSEPNRDIVPGYDHSECSTLTEDCVRQQVKWKRGHSLNALKGKQIHLEIFLSSLP